GDIIQTGIAQRMSVDELACAAFDADTAIDNIALHIIDETGDDSPEFDCTQDQLNELAVVVRAVIVTWITRHALTASSYRVVDVHDYTVTAADVAGGEPGPVATLVIPDEAPKAQDALAQDVAG